MAGVRYTIQPGDTIARVALDHGFRTWEAVWEHPENAEIRALRSSAHVLAPGDALFVPEKRERAFGCATRMRHVFRLRTMKQSINVRVLDGDRVHAGCAFALEFDGRTLHGATDDEGYARADVPVETTRATLKVALDPEAEEVITFTLNLGHLAPLSTLAGVRQRLKNLGFPCGEGEGPVDDDMMSALSRFQTSAELSATGELDEVTRARLGELHDQPEE